MDATRNRRPPDLQGRVEAFVSAHLPPAVDVTLGLSGGCDSVVLLHLLRRIPALGGRLGAVHVHHGLSAHADAWADFCTDYCTALEIPLQVIRVSVPRQSGAGLEAAARQARYAAFADHAANCLCLAQHRGDQAETVLLNLLRGTGLTGAAGMPAERQIGRLRVFRPLLTVTRADIEAYAQAHGLRWVEDDSNADIGFRRNFLRREVLPRLASRFPALEANLAQAAAHFGEAAGLLDALAESDWQIVRRGETATLRELRQLPMPRLKNLLRYRLRQLGWQVPVASRLEEFARQLSSAAPDRHPELVLPAGVMRVRAGCLHWLQHP